MVSAHRIEETVARGICIGCGGCSAVSQGAISVTLGPTRLYEADLSGASQEEIRAGSRVCPFSDESPNEDELGAPQGWGGLQRHPELGEFTRTFAGRVADDEYVMGSSSGGLTSWLLSRLVDEGVVDAVINVGATGDNVGGDLFRFDVVSDDPSTRRKSQYYATSMAEVLDLVQHDQPRRYVLVGVPCYIRAARSLCHESELFADRIVMFVSLVCGHLKTQAYAESLAWQLQIPPAELGAADFRLKSPHRESSDYDFGARRLGEGEIRRAPTSELVGGNWGHNFFQPEACNFCDDVVGETADVSFGDAWLPQFTQDPRGTNVVISRNRAIDEHFDAAAAQGEIDVLPASPDEVAASQAGGFRHRREGLSVRLADDIAAGLSVPVKRVAADRGEVGARRANLYRQRRRMAQLSQVLFAEAVESANLDVYLRGMRAEVRRYRRLEAPSVRVSRGLRPVRRVLRPVKRFYQAWFSRG
jgi:coenzyme F420 hydrogenase subunit beta